MQPLEEQLARAQKEAAIKETTEAPARKWADIYRQFWGTGIQAWKAQEAKRRAAEDFARQQEEFKTREERIREEAGLTRQGEAERAKAAQAASYKRFSEGIKGDPVAQAGMAYGQAMLRDQNMAELVQKAEAEGTQIEQTPDGPAPAPGTTLRQMWDMANKEKMLYAQQFAKWVEANQILRQQRQSGTLDDAMSAEWQKIQQTLAGLEAEGQ